ncbi:tetratricopeptide repeat protein [Stieleria varia]|uniref:Tetratricopeptide repeat protein n=1 Tax=Stieleria varia TaxID=2528005 RepID=A0A5C6B3B2_9BACT|nr:tetratricopeptide repeat protein [Stieleria varia]TWU06012.1 Tetratricopeptide repeat protein [Stieleria varia]
MGKTSKGKGKPKKRMLPTRRRQRASSRVMEVVTRLSRNQEARVSDAHAMILKGRYRDAQAILERLDRQGTYLAVIEALAMLYERTNQHDLCAHHASRLMRLTPNDAEILLLFGKASTFGSRTAVALLALRQFLSRWPDHPQANIAHELLGPAEVETKSRLKMAGFEYNERGLRLQSLHEQSIAALSLNRFDDVQRLCKELIAEAPEFCSARNNLAISLFHSGDLEQAVKVAEEATRVFPENWFSRILLTKLRFLGGFADEAECTAFAEELVSNPPDSQDPIVAAEELLSMMGKDTELLKFIESIPQSLLVDDIPQGMHLHFEAYVRCRLGEQSHAERLWTRAADLLPGGGEASENLEDLRARAGHAPWPGSMAQWLPITRMRECSKILRSASNSTLASGQTKLLPHFLDRGDEALRTFAVAFALAKGSKEALEHLKTFSMSDRGSDSLRHKVLSELWRREFVDEGPHPFFARGKWSEVAFHQAEIIEDSVGASDFPQVNELIAEGVDALYDERFDDAERLFDEALKIDPLNPNAAYNKALAWLQRDDDFSVERATAAFSEIHKRSPDYIFAGLALASLLARDGKLEEANEKMSLYSLRKRLHISEAKALYVVQAEILMLQGNLEGAETVYQLARDIVGDDPQVVAIREALDSKIFIAKRG